MTTDGQESKPDSLPIATTYPSLLILKNGRSNFLNATSIHSDHPRVSWPQGVGNVINKEKSKKIMNEHVLTNNNVIEEYEEEWAYEDEINSSELIDDEKDFSEEESSNILTTPTSEPSSSVEALIDGIESTRLIEQKHNKIIQSPQQRFFSTVDDHFITERLNGEINSEPMLQDTHIYFAKILEFDEEPELQNKWPYEGN